MKHFGFVALLALFILSGCQTQQTPQDQKNEDARIDVRVRWAQEHIKNREYEEAKKPLTQALDINPDHPKILNLLAFVFQQQGETAIAEEYFERMLRADPSFAPGQNNYGIFLMYQGRYDEACKRFLSAASNPLYEGRPQALENLATCYEEAGRPADAEVVYRQVLGLTPYSSTATVGLATRLYDQGEKGEARQLYDQFSAMVDKRGVDHTAKSLWLGLRLARDANDVGMAATYALLLKNMFPNSPEYQQYKESRQ